MTKSSLSFGLACIDSLIHPWELQYKVGNGKPIVTCIAGPDGVGKSIIALTASSIYAARKDFKHRKVIYASTDLNIDQAETTWRDFGLDMPRRRRNKIREEIESYYLDQGDLEKLRNRDKALEKDCRLRWLAPFTEEGIRAEVSGNGTQLESLDILFKDSDEPSVHFLDLAGYSAGDDWGMINHIIGLLQCNSGASQCPHLLVIDAVEGLEAMAGNYDRFGLMRSRRSRLAQLVRLTRKANCSVIFIIEQRSSDVHLDEVFVSDLVLRLRAQECDDYLQKTLELEKVRSVPHIRGIHELQIRDGRGSSEMPAPDDPPLFLAPSRPLAYMQIMPSLHQKSKAPVSVVTPVTTA